MCCVLCWFQVFTLVQSDPSGIDVTLIKFSLRGTVVSWKCDRWIDSLLPLNCREMIFLFGWKEKRNEFVIRKTMLVFLGIHPIYGQ